MPHTPLVRVATAATALGLGVGLVPSLLAGPVLAAPAAAPTPLPAAAVTGPLPGTLGGDRLSADVSQTYPFFAAYENLGARGYVEQEFLVSGSADAYSTTADTTRTPGTLLEEDVPYQTRIVVRRPADPRLFNGTALVEWQNVTAGYDLDALWNTDDVTRNGYAWVGVSAQRVGVDQLKGWSPARYGSLDVTGGGEYVQDQLSFDVYAQAAKALVAPTGTDPMGGLDVQTVLSIGASQSTRYQSTYYDAILPKVEPVFDGYAIVVGTAPARAGATEPVFQVQSETDVQATSVRRADSRTFRRWEVAGTAHSGWTGQVYRLPLQQRDLGAVTPADCDAPPYSRVPMNHVTAAAYAHLERWAEDGVLPPRAKPLQFNPDGTKARNALGLAKGGIRLSQVAVPTALNTGDNSGQSFCRLYGTHVPYSAEQMSALYAGTADYLAEVRRVDARNVREGYLQPADARANLQEARKVRIPGTATGAAQVQLLEQAEQTE